MTARFSKSAGDLKSKSDVESSGERPVGRSASFECHDRAHVSNGESQDMGDTKKMLLKFLPSLEEAEVRQVGNIQRWQRGNLVGSGSYGKVYLAMNADTAELFVVKQVPFTAIDKREEVLQLEQEIALLAQLEHANIVRYLGTELSAVTSELSIFLEYMPGGSIADLVRQFGGLEESVIRRFTREVLDGLDYLHGKGIIHRDIKGQNILVDSHGRCKLADFGASRYLQATDTSSPSEMSFKGTPVFMPPEVIISQQYSKKSDVWSYGCTVLQMASGSPPFSEFSNHVAALIHITQAESPPPIPSKLSDECRNFIELCLQRIVSRRPYVSEIPAKYMESLSLSIWSMSSDQVVIRVTWLGVDVACSHRFAAYSSATLNRQLLLHPFVGNGTKAHQVSNKDVSPCSILPCSQAHVLPALAPTMKAGGSGSLSGSSQRPGQSEAHEEDEKLYRQFRQESLQRISVPIRRETQRRHMQSGGSNVGAISSALPTRPSEAYCRQDRPMAGHTSAASAASLAPTESDEHIGVGGAAAASHAGSAGAVAVVTVLQCMWNARGASCGLGAHPPHVLCTARLGAAEYRSRPTGGDASWEPRLDEVFVFALPVTDGTESAARWAAVGEDSEWVEIRVLDAHQADSGRAELGRTRVPVPRAGAGHVEAWYPLVPDGQIHVRASRAQVRSGSARRGHAGVHTGLSGDSAGFGNPSTPARIDRHTECSGTAGPVAGVGSMMPGGIGAARHPNPSPPGPSPSPPACLVTGVPTTSLTRQTPSPLLTACDSDESCDGDGANGLAGLLLRPPRMASAPARPRNK